MTRGRSRLEIETSWNLSPQELSTKTNQKQGYQSICQLNELFFHKTARSADNLAVFRSGAATVPPSALPAEQLTGNKQVVRIVIRGIRAREINTFEV